MFKEAALLRKDATFERINLEELSIKWHGRCYQSYTSKRNLAFVGQVGNEAKDEVRSSRARVKVLD